MIMLTHVHAYPCVFVMSLCVCTFVRVYICACVCACICVTTAGCVWSTLHWAVVGCFMGEDAQACKAFTKLHD